MSWHEVYPDCLHESRSPGWAQSASRSLPRSLLRDRPPHDIRWVSSKAPRWSIYGVIQAVLEVELPVPPKRNGGAWGAQCIGTNSGLE